jgi:hypothetical protein
MSTPDEAGREAPGDELRKNADGARSSRASGQRSASGESPREVRASLWALASSLFATTAALLGAVLSGANLFWDNIKAIWDDVKSLSSLYIVVTFVAVVLVAIVIVAGIRQFASRRRGSAGTSEEPSAINDPVVRDLIVRAAADQLGISRGMLSARDESAVTDE